MTNSTLLNKASLLTFLIPGNIYDVYFYDIPNGALTSGESKPPCNLNVDVWKQSIREIMVDAITNETLIKYQWSLARLIEYCFEYDAVNSFRTIIKYNLQIDKEYLELFVTVSLIHDKLEFYKILVDEFYWTICDHDLRIVFSPEILRFMVSKGVQLNHQVYLKFCTDMSIDIIIRLYEEFRIPFSSQMVINTIKGKHLECFKFLLNAGCPIPYPLGGLIQKASSEYSTEIVSYLKMLINVSNPISKLQDEECTNSNHNECIIL